MASQYEKLHILMFPLMAQGHTIPMVDIARLLAQRGVKITVVTTQANATRVEPAIRRARESGLGISMMSLRFPCEEAGIPEGLQSLDAITNPNQLHGFYKASSLLRGPAEKLAMALEPKPDCVVSDMILPWTIHVARALSVPRVSFNGMNCFCNLFLMNLQKLSVREDIETGTEYFAIPDVPDRIEITKAQIPGAMGKNLDEHLVSIIEAEMDTMGIIVNSFEEMESDYAERYKEAKNGKTWCVGPVSLCNDNSIDKALRGNGNVNDRHECLKWLDSKGRSSVVYVCLGSLCNLIAPQLIELALGLEMSEKPFVWVTGDRKRNVSELEKWIEEDGFEERVKVNGQGILIRGWAPQVLILSHPSIGGFLTHCGWNSTLEGICAGVPLLTWPLFADQFLNEKLVTRALRIAVSLGVELPMLWGEEEKIGVQIGREKVKAGLESLMNGEESGERRARVRKLGEMAKRAVGEGGSSHDNIRLFLDEILELGNGQRVGNLEKSNFFL